jgi:DNA helicase II / ATP-dependent DNA helicase PcrA
MASGATVDVITGPPGETSAALRRTRSADRIPSILTDRGGPAGTGPSATTVTRQMIPDGPRGIRPQPRRGVAGTWQDQICHEAIDNGRADRCGMFHADLHIHSRFSRACSRDCDLEHLAWWALRKGITVVGTGDFTHPGWAEELRESLVPAEPGLFRLGKDADVRLRRASPRSCAGEVRFMLSAEISTIYRGGERTRKVHHLLYAPTFQAAERITRALSRIGNLASDGRPILGLDSRHLLEITLDGGPGCYLVPAHAWTPWFAVLGSKSGFDVVADCYGDLAGHIFALETGLSSDPPMNWMCSSLDGYRLVSNSDAHSPPMLGREATTFGVQLDYFAMADALRTGEGLAGTIEFYPEEGKYHLDGHRKCGVRFEPAQSREHEGTCPECGKPLTIGVLHRVAELADRPAGYRPPGAPGFTNLLQLPQIVGEILATGPKSKKVGAEVARLVAALGPELGILTEADADNLRRVGGSLLAEAVGRMRRGEVRREAGYDGEYGVITLFGPRELDRADALFDLAGPATLRPKSQEMAAQGAGGPGKASGREEACRARWSGEAGSGRADGAAALARGLVPAQPGTPDALAHSPRPAPPGSPDFALGGLDLQQRAAAEAESPLMIIAGPGTGKTRTLTHRIAHDVLCRGLAPQSCLAITFTRRAAEEMRGRLAALLPGQVPGVTVTTFHGLGLTLLREHHDRAALAAGFLVADDAARLEVAAELMGSPREGRRLLAEAATRSSSGSAARELLVQALAARDLVDFDGLVELPAALLAAEPDLAESLRERWPRISVDEYQDIDAIQYRLLRRLAGEGRGLTVIGDPDQAIYGFRGADVSLFLRFGDDYPGAATRQLTRNYRSSAAIVAGALQAIAPSSLVPGRVLQAAGRAAPAAPGGPGTRAPGGTLPVPADALIGLHEAADERAEGAWIAREIERLLGGASFHSLDTGRAGAHGHDGLSLSDIAVLYRTDAQAEPIGQALTRAGLPFQKRAHDLLERRTGVAEIVREMRLASAGGTDHGDMGPDGRGIAERLRRAVRTLAARAGGAAGSAAAVDARTAGEVLAPLARRCGHDLDRFLTEISLGAEADALDPRADAVTLLTLHAAKGLEFEVVFLAGCERNLLPLWLPGQGPPAAPDLAEERRLLFVGITRARARLFLTCASRRRWHGGTRDAGPSPFLAAIDPARLDRSAAPVRPGRPAGRQLRLL